MQTITLADVPANLWRNGGGLTRLLADGRLDAQPAVPGAPHLDAFDWRLSLADIAADGPFSSFPGVDRHAVLLGSGGVNLSGPSGGALARPLAPVSFPGEAELFAQRQPGSLQPRFLNLMVRRAVLRGELCIVDSAGPIGGDTVVWMLLPVAGRWKVSGVDGESVADAGQAIVSRASDAAHAVPLTLDARAVLALVRTLSALSA